MSTVHSSHVVKTPVIVSFGWTRDASRRSTRALAPSRVIRRSPTFRLSPLNASVWHALTGVTFDKKYFAERRSCRFGFARAAFQQRARLGFVLREVFERRVQVLQLALQHFAMTRHRGEERMQL